MAADPQLLQSLAQWHNAKAVILGIGNALKGDDAAGPLVCERLAGRVSAKVIDAGTTPENYITPILRVAPDVLLIVDAMDFGGEPGQMRVCTPDELHRYAISTHALSLHLAIDMIRRDTKLDVRLIGIQANRMKFGDSLSPAVRDAAAMLADTLAELFTPAE